MINYLAISKKPHHNIPHCVVAVAINLEDLIFLCCQRQFGPDDVTIYRIKHNEGDIEFVHDTKLRAFMETKTIRVWKKP
jgi:hypothetical protein